jgi:hypothetical protein
MSAADADCGGEPSVPNKGYKQSPAHRRKIQRALARRSALVDQALGAYQLKMPEHLRKKGAPNPHHQKPDPVPTPIPPSASKITSDLPQRWGIYSHHAEGRYYYKREQADSLPALQKVIRSLDLRPPYWTYVKSGRTADDLVLPIRIPEEAVKSLGHRWHFLKEKVR